jgi:hypothetical protein
MRVGFLTLALASLAPACGRDTSDVAPVPTAQPYSAAKSAVDHLEPGELIEGKETVLGLKVPRDLRVTISTKDRGIAEGRVETERVANYVRARVKDGKVTVGASSTVFEGVKLAQAQPPDRLLRVSILSVRGQCHLEVWDITPPKPTEPDPGNDPDRLRRAGLNPDGTPLDPLHTQ